MKKIVSLIMGISIATSSCFGAAVESKVANEAFNAIMEKVSEVFCEKSTDIPKWISHDWTHSEIIRDKDCQSLRKLLTDSASVAFDENQYWTLFGVGVNTLCVPLIEWVFTRFPLVKGGCESRKDLNVPFFDRKNVRAAEREEVVATKSNSAPSVRVIAYVKYLLMLMSFHAGSAIHDLHSAKDFWEQLRVLECKDRNSTRRDEIEATDFTVRLTADDMDALIRTTESFLAYYRTEGRRPTFLSGVLPNNWLRTYTVIMGPRSEVRAELRSRREVADE